MTPIATPANILPLQDFESKAGPRLVFGVDSVNRVGELARDWGAEKILLVTDAGIVTAGHARRVLDSLGDAGMEAIVFDKVVENPTTGCVDQCVEEARQSGIDAIIGLGGGSSMDTAKGCNFLLTNGGRMQDYRGIGKAARPMLPLIAIPTTAGTGSECQSFALITDESTHQKMACGDPKAAARVAILDPGLTVSQPFRVTACTGIDAIAHALETAVTRKRNPVSTLYSFESLKLLLCAFPRVLQTPGDIAARGQMQLGAAFAGTAIENSMLGAAHAAANPLTAHFNIVHGMAVGMMLPAVIRFNAAQAKIRSVYEQLCAACLPPLGMGSDPIELLASRIGSLLNEAQMPRSLAELGVTSSDISGLAREAEQQWTAAFNPRAIAAADFEGLYRAAMQPRE